jgi:hypothetical protein
MNRNAFAEVFNALAQIFLDQHIVAAVVSESLDRAAGVCHLELELIPADRVRVGGAPVVAHGGRAGRRHDDSRRAIDLERRPVRRAHVEDHAGPRKIHRERRQRVQQRGCRVVAFHRECGHVTPLR